MSRAMRDLAFPLQLLAPEAQPSHLYRSALAALMIIAAAMAWLAGAQQERPTILALWG